MLTVLYNKKPAAAWAALASGTLMLYLVGGPHLFTFSMLGFTWAFAKIGCLSQNIKSETMAAHRVPVPIRH